MERPNIVVILTDDQRWDTVRGIMPVVENELLGAGWSFDLAPTLAQFAGITPPAPLDGRSLTTFFSDPAAVIGRKGVLIEHSPGGRVPAYCGYRTAEELFVRYATGDEEYYRYSKDPYELKNRALLPSAQSNVAKLRSITRSRCSPMPPGMIWE